MTLDLVAVVEVLTETRFAEDDPSAVGFAGDVYNTAVYCARALEDAGTVGFVTRIGQDALSKRFLEAAEIEHIDLSHAENDDSRNIGLYAITTSDSGERSFDYWRDQSAARLLFWTKHEKLALPKAKVTYLSGITLAIMTPQGRRRLLDHLRVLEETGRACVSFDSNFRPALWENSDTARDVIAETWDIASIALPSVDDEMALFGDANEASVIARLASGTWRACAIKRGENGPVSPNIEASAHPVFTPASRVVDTTAAGDSFNGGFLAAWLRHQDISVCMMAGHTLASQVVCQSGAIIPRSQAQN